MYDQLLRDPSLPVSNSTESYWQSPPSTVLHGIRSDTLPKIRDVVIIGSGITGCSVARELLTNNFKGTITILEAREVCSGATGRNGGRINCTAVHDYEKYRRKFNDEAAKSIVRFKMGHLDEITAAAKSMGSEKFHKSEVRDVDTIAAVFSDKKLQDLRTMLSDFEVAFPEWQGRFQIVTDEVHTLYGINGAKGALVGRGGAAWPYRFITSIYESLLSEYKAQLSIETHTPALSVIRKSTQTYPYLVETPRGNIQATHVIHCTEGHSAHLLPSLRGMLLPRQGQMTVQNPGQNFKGTHGQRSWSFYFDHGFDYLCENEHTGEIFIGGGEVGGFDAALEMHGVASDADESIAAKSHLLGVLPVVFGRDGWGPERPGKPQLQASWTGVMCASLDAVPMVGMLPESALGSRPAGTLENGAEWISAGYGGYGMVNAWRCGKAVAQQVLGNGVPAWLPAQYQTSEKRVRGLQDKLAKIANSEAHLRAFLS